MRIIGFYPINRRNISCVAKVTIETSDSEEAIIVPFKPMNELYSVDDVNMDNYCIVFTVYVNKMSYCSVK